MSNVEKLPAFTSQWVRWGVNFEKRLEFRTLNKCICEVITTGKQDILWMHHPEHTIPRASSREDLKAEGSQKNTV